MGDHMGTIACYVRVSTDDQSLERQLQATSDYADQRFGADLSELSIYHRLEPTSTAQATER